MRPSDTVGKFERIRLRVGKVHFPVFVAGFFGWAEHPRGYCLPQASRTIFFYFEGDIANLFPYFLAEIVGVRLGVLIAEDVEDVAVLAGLDIAIPTIGPYTQPNRLASICGLDIKLPFNLPKPRTQPQHSGYKEPK